MRKYLVSLALFLSAAAHGQQTYPKCDAGNWMEASAFVKKRVTLMKIAASKADFKNLEAYAFGIGSPEIGLEKYLDSCKGSQGGMSANELLSRVCDSNCFVQRANVYLFKMAELPFFISGQKLDGQKITTATAADFDAAKKIIKDGLNSLSLMSYGDFELEKNKDDKNSESISFTAFLRESTRLNTMQARLYIAMGDIYYQQVSRNRAETLRKKIKNSLNGTTTGSKSGGDLYLADTYYEQASWILQDALVDVPQTTNFSAEAFEIKSLRNDVTSRLGSIKKGYLFLNIDPEAFTTMPASRLLDYLQNQLQELTNLESNIEREVEGWLKDKTAEQRRDIDNERVRDSRSIELKSHQILELDGIAEKLQQNYQSVMEKNGQKILIEGGQLELIERQSMLSNLTFELERTRLEVKHQIKMLNAQREQDLTVLSKEAHIERREDFKWLIDANLTAMNLDLQISQLATQIKDLRDQQSIKETEKMAFEQAIQGREALIEVERSRVDELEAGKRRIEESRQDLYKMKRRAVVYEICSMLAEKAKYVGSSGSFSDGPSDSSCQAVTVSKPDAAYWQEVIDLRKQFFGNSGSVIKSIEKIQDCLVKSNCDGVAAQKETLLKIHNREKEIFEQVERPAIEKIRDQIRDQIDAIQSAKTGTTITGVIGAIGNAAGKLLTGGLGGLLGAVTGGFNDGTAIALAQVGLANDKKMAEISLNELELRLEKALKEVDGEEAMSRLVLNRSLAEIYGQNFQWEQQKIQIKAETVKLELDGKNTLAKIEAEKVKFDAQIESLKAQLNQMTAENDLLNYDIQIFEKQVDQANFRSQSLGFEKAELGLRVASIDQDIDRMNSMIKSADQQKKLVEDTKDSVKSLNNQVNVESGIIKGLREKEAQKIGILAESQINQFENLLLNDESRIKEAMAFVKNQMQHVINKINIAKDSIDITDQFNIELKVIKDQIAAKRSEIIALASKSDGFDAQKNLFIASEELIATLTKGVPDYIRAKKDRLQFVNYVFNLYRNRADILNELVDSDQKKGDLPYIQSAQQLRDAVSEMCAIGSEGWRCKEGSLAFSNDSINVAETTFNIPVTSGFMSQLLTKGVVRFEITPEALRGVSSTDPESIDKALRSNGYFMLWDARMSRNYKMNVANITLGANFQNSAECKGQSLSVRHLGFGSRYSSLGDSVQADLAIVTPRYEVARVWDSLTEDAKFNHYMQALGPSMSLSDFKETIVNHVGDSRKSLPFLGAPLVGTYEISFLENIPRQLSCFSDASLKIGVSYTVAYKSRN